MPAHSTPDLYDCVIVGGGPAGISAAIYLARFNRSVIVCDHGDGRWTTREINENYLGFPDGIAAMQLRELGRRQAERFGAAFADLFVQDVQRGEGAFTVRGDNGEACGRTIILATGVQDILPEFDNADAREYFGMSLFWCITCDGYKTRGARVAIVGNDDGAATTALQFLNFTDQIALITNAPHGACRINVRKRAGLEAAGIPLYEGTITTIEGSGGRMSAVDLDDGRRVELDFMFNQQGARPNAALARQLGIVCDPQGYVRVDNEQRTNVPFVYAAGDLTKEFAHQIVTAAHEGATAGTTANYDLYRPDQRE